jgi:hypothetical protein
MILATLVDFILSHFQCFHDNNWLMFVLTCPITIFKFRSLVIQFKLKFSTKIMLSPYLNGTGLISNKNQVLILLGNMTRLLDLFAFVGNIEFGCAQIVGLENGHFFSKSLVLTKCKLILYCSFIVVSKPCFPFLL